MISAVVVNYRTPAEVAAAVGSLEAQSTPPGEIVVVDNGAAEGAPMPALPGAERVRIVRPPSNVGFGAGCNWGAREAAGDQLLFMNADVVLRASALAALADRLARHPRVAVAAPRVFSGGRLQHSARAFPSLRTGLLGRRSLLTRALIRAKRSPAELRPAHGAGGRVDWVSGACMLVRRTAFDEAGGFDEGYWMYWEDADLCRRLATRGWEVHFEPAAVVQHATGASGTSERTVRAFHESAARFAERHIARGRATRVLYRSLLQARMRLTLRLMARRP